MYNLPTEWKQGALCGLKLRFTLHFSHEHLPQVCLRPRRTVTHISVLQSKHILCVSGQWALTAEYNSEDLLSGRCKIESISNESCVFGYDASVRWWTHTWHGGCLTIDQLTGLHKQAPGKWVLSGRRHSSTPVQLQQLRDTQFWAASARALKHNENVEGSISDHSQVIRHVNKAMPEGNKSNNALLSHYTHNLHLN